MGKAVGWASLLLAASLPARVLASEPRFAWDAPIRCPDGDAVLAAVSVLLDTPVVDFGAFTSIQGRVEQVGAEWRLSLELVDGSRRRSRVIAAPTCDDLAQAAGVAIALALDATRADALADASAGSGRESEGAARSPAATGVPDAERPGAPRMSSPQGPSAERHVSTAEPSSPREHGGVLLAADAVFDAAALPDGAFGVQLSGGWRQGRNAVSGYGVWLPARSDATLGEGSVKFALLAGGIRLQHEFTHEIVALTGEVGVELGELSATGVALADARAFSDFWLAPNLGLALGSELGAGWSWHAAATGLVPLLRQAYHVDVDELVHQPPVVDFRVAIGFGLVVN
jgi:hypothetical protein